MKVDLTQPMTTIDGTLITDDGKTIEAGGSPMPAKTLCARALVCDLTEGNVHSITLDVDATFTFSNPPASGRSGVLTLYLTQPSVAKAVTWPSSVNWGGDGEPNLFSSGAATFILTFTTIDYGSVWDGFLVRERD